MSLQPIRLESLPVSDWVSKSIRDCFSHEDIDFRDVTLLIKQDPVFLANFMQKVNVIFTGKNRPVVNTLSSAINLLGIDQLKEILLSLDTTKSQEISAENAILCELIRDRITMAAFITEYWADYMGEQAAEELFCASMYTGLNEFSDCICGNHNADNSETNIDLESIESVKSIYDFENNHISQLPDSIQQVHCHSTVSNRLKLSMLVYQLLSSIERGFSTPVFQEALAKVSEYIGISEYRASYDTAQCIIKVDKESLHKTYYFSHFLLSTNIEMLKPLPNY